MKRQKASSRTESKGMHNPVCSQPGCALPITRGSIDDRKEEIVRLHTEIGESFKTSVGKAVRIGELLINIKGELEHGQWGIWIKENLPFSQSTAERYMSLSEHRDKFVSLPNLTLFDAYKLLAHKKPQSKVDQSPESRELRQEAEVPRKQMQEKSSTEEPEAETPDESTTIQAQEEVQEAPSPETEHTRATKLPEETDLDENDKVWIEISRTLYSRAVRAAANLSERPHREGKIVTLAQFVAGAVTKECIRVEKKEKEIAKGRVELSEKLADGDSSIPYELRGIIAKCARFSST